MLSCEMLCFGIGIVDLGVHAWSPAASVIANSFASPLVLLYGEAHEDISHLQGFIYIIPGLEETNCQR